MVEAAFRAPVHPAENARGVGVPALPGLLQELRRLLRVLLHPAAAPVHRADKARGSCVPAPPGLLQGLHRLRRPTCKLDPTLSWPPQRAGHLPIRQYHVACHANQIVGNAV